LSPENAATSARVFDCLVEFRWPFHAKPQEWPRFNLGAVRLSSAVFVVEGRGFDLFRRILATGIVFAALTSLAAAASIDIGGNYGDEAGCRFAADPDNFIGDAYTVLTPDEFKTSSVACDFVDSAPVWEKYGNRIVVVTALCGHEGAEAMTTELLRIEKRSEGADGYSVYDAQGAEIGGGDRCK